MINTAPIVGGELLSDCFLDDGVRVANVSFRQSRQYAVTTMTIELTEEPMACQNGSAIFALPRRSYDA